MFSQGGGRVCGPYWHYHMHHGISHMVASGQVGYPTPWPGGIPYLLSPWDTLPPSPGIPHPPPPWN